MALMSWDGTGEFLIISLGKEYVATMSVFLASERSKFAGNGEGTGNGMLSPPFPETCGASGHKQPS